nr:MAG TPA: hypothetical protein [Caudoviricetes sp.]
MRVNPIQEERQRIYTRIILSIREIRLNRYYPRRTLSGI